MSDGLWVEDPLVLHVAGRVGTEDTLLFAETLLEVMHELEAKAPGVPFREILEAPRVDDMSAKLTTVRVLRAEGYTDEFIEELIGPWQEPPTWLDIHRQLVERYDAGVTKADLRPLFGMSEKAVEMILARYGRGCQPLTEERRALGELACEIGPTLAAERHGVSRKTAQKCRDLVRAEKELVAG